MRTYEPWRYPTKEEILKVPVPHKKATVQTVLRWKLSHKRLNNEIALYDLITDLAKVYGVKVNIEFGKPYACFVPATNTIQLNNRSILTALHEFSHKVYGSSERQACRWSAWLFMKCFPERMRKLEWDGHLLVAKKPYANTNPRKPAATIRG